MLLAENDIEKFKSKLDSIINEILHHSGFGEVRLDIRWVKQGHKEIIITAGKQYRYIVAVDND